MTRAEDLAKRLEQVNQEAIKMVEGCSDAQWRALCAPEKWSVNVAAHHIAGGHEPIAGFVLGIATGQPLPPITEEMFDQRNAEHAKQFANCSKQETLALLRSGGAKAATIVRGLSDAQLDRTATSAAMGPEPRSAQWVAENVLIGHAQGHLESIRAAIK